MSAHYPEFADGAHYAGKPVHDLTIEELRMIAVVQHIELRLWSLWAPPHIERLVREKTQNYATLVAIRDGENGLRLVPCDPRTGLLIEPGKQMTDSQTFAEGSLK